jgi:hypothetical protein
MDELQSVDHVGVGRVKTVVAGWIEYPTPPTCDHHEPDADGQPTPGTRCGEPAQWVILWDNWLYSLGCNTHSMYDAFDPEGFEHILELTTL